VAVGLILIARDAAWQADLWMFHLVNGWSGNWVLDWGAIYASKTYLLNGAIIMAAYWWVWFLPGPDQDRRTKIISALIAAIITLIVARALASVLPFRLRPLSAPGIGYHGPNLPSGQNITGFEDWSSFPSDQAALFFALAVGLWRCSRPLGAIAILIATIGVCAVRVYLGIHYPSDVIAGAAIGVLCVYATGHIASGRPARIVLAFERDFPPAFYAAMFLITFEIGSLFDDVREFMHGVLVALRASGMHTLSLMGVLAMGVGAMAAISLAVGLIVRSRRGHA
jgi:membrane-associated phospholipid phosphatase